MTGIFTQPSISHLLQLGFEKNHTVKQYKMSFTELVEIQCCIENQAGQTTEKSKVNKCMRKLYGEIGQEK